ncbi:hypothetical protein J27TS7_16350 [Paenibacillus dendritiformis]|uniref:hypothetical protein n=1 Tax=Paenibacillus dendritiformis TaxID=130049 RepID=UPI001B0B529B|nr:hypothetical protein [Paenibacillus dendritiformis]GIO72121.1 hypothetical protein J27TS7_16350 [Paenibacillus dendritiformis]
MGAGKKTKYNSKFIEIGEQIIADMPKSQRENLCSLSHTLHFVALLGFQSFKSKRNLINEDRKSKSCPFKVGISLYSDIDIEVPVIDVLLDKHTEITMNQIGSRSIKKEEEFDLTYYEFMFLMLRDEYAGFFEANDDPRGGYVSLYLKAFEKGDAKLPTPSIQFKRNKPKNKSGYREDVVPITEKIIPIDKKVQGEWKVIPKYADKYGPLLEHLLKKREEGKKRIAQSMRELHLTSK